MFRKLLLAVLWLYSLAHFAATGVRQALRLFTSDFLAAFPYGKIAEYLGRPDMYRGSLAEQWAWEFGAPPVWHYGPLLHLITLPLFAFSDLRTAFTFWLFVNFIFLAASLWMLIRVISDDRPTFATISIVVIVALNFNPLYEALIIRAIEVFELMLLVAAFTFYRRGRSAAAGVTIGLAVMAKFLPLIYLPYFFVRRDWRAFWAAVATIVPLAIATQLLLGWQLSGTVRQLTAANGSFIMFDENQSLAGAVFRLVKWTGNHVDGGFASRIAILLGLAALSALFFRIRNSKGLLDLEWWMLATVMILLPPHNQNYYAIFLLPAYLFLGIRYHAEKRWRSIRGAVFAVSFLLVALPVPMSIVSRIIGVQAWPIYLKAGLQFAGAAMLVALLTMELLSRYASRSITSLPPISPEPVSPLRNRA